MKKVISTLALAALLSPLSVFAAQQAFTGWSAGVNFGVIDAQSKFNDTTSWDLPALPLAFSWNESGRLGKSSGIIGISLAYADCFSPCWNWAIEGRASWTNLKTGWDRNSLNEAGLLIDHAHLQAKLNQEYGIIAKLGYVLCNQTQLYGFVGPQWGQFKVNSHTDQFIDSSPSVYTAFVGNGGDSDYKTGLLAGLGIETMIDDCISVGLEYDYSNYGSRDVFASTNFFHNSVLDTTTTLTKAANIKITSNAMLLKFGYYFA